MAGKLSQQQQQLVEDILTCVGRMPVEKKYQYLGVAQGMSLSAPPAQPASPDAAQRCGG